MESTLLAEGGLSAGGEAGEEQTILFSDLYQSPSLCPFSHYQWPYAIFHFFSLSTPLSCASIGLESCSPAYLNTQVLKEFFGCSPSFCQTC